MAKSVFTPARLQELIARMRTLQKEWFEAGDKANASRIFAAISSLERENEPEHNYFLIALCFVSMRSAMGEMTGTYEDA